MDADSVHSVIERKASFQIITSWDWLQLARISDKKNIHGFWNDNSFKQYKLTSFWYQNQYSYKLDIKLQELCTYLKTTFNDEEFDSVDLNRRV